MKKVSVIGIDLAKQVFQLSALSADGEEMWARRFNRASFIRFMAEKAPRCLVGLEACGGAHYWGRFLTARGFAVKLISPKAVKGYLTGEHKNDRRDARAIAEAASRPWTTPVTVRSEQSQAVQALVKVRARRIRQLVQTANQLRGILNEFGIVLPRGTRRMVVKLNMAMKEALWSTLPATLQALAGALIAEIDEQAMNVKAANGQLVALVGQEPSCRRLMSIPHIGPINAASLAVALEVPQAFRSARAFAAHLRLVPRQRASADKSILLGVGRQSANQARCYLVLAAQGLLTRIAGSIQPPDDPFLAWAHSLLKRKTRNVAAVAVAGKLARIAWAVLATGKDYNPCPIKA
jgi:transposase